MTPFAVTEQASLSPRRSCAIYCPLKVTTWLGSQPFQMTHERMNPRSY